MNSKHVITTILILFVIASVAYLVLKEFRDVPAEGISDEATRDAGARDTDVPTGKPAGSGRTVIAYYFMTTKRCPTCRKIEAYTTEAIETMFAGELEAGRLEFHVVNVDDAENEHYIDDYQLTTKSVVLADYRNGEQTRWKNLDRVWHYVGDKQTFVNYIESETREFIGDLLDE